MPEQVVFEREPAPTLIVPGVSPPASTQPPKQVRRFELPPEKPAAPAAPATPATPAVTTPQGEGQDKADTAPAAKPEDKPATPEEAEKRSTRRFERRLDKLYRKAAEERARADLLERQLAELKTPVTPVDPGEPKLEQFDFDVEKYATAKAKYETDKVLKQRESEARQSKASAFQQQLVTSWEAKAARAEDKYDDFDEKVGKLDTRTPIGMAIMQADNGEEIAYHLATHLDEVKRIGALDPLAQVREIGKLEVRLAAQAEKPKTPSTAPAPISPVTGTTQASSEAPSEEDDMGTWIRKRTKQLGRPNAFRR